MRSSAGPQGNPPAGPSRTGLKDAKVEDATKFIEHVCAVADIKHLQHNWTIADFFHEIMDDEAPATDTPRLRTP